MNIQEIRDFYDTRLRYLDQLREIRKRGFSYPLAQQTDDTFKEMFDFTVKLKREMGGGYYFDWALKNLGGEVAYMYFYLYDYAV